MSVYNVTYKTLGHTHPRISTAEEMGSYSPPKKGMESERNFSLTPSSFNLEIELDTHRIFHPENHRETRTWSYEIDKVSHSLTWEKE